MRIKKNQIYLTIIFLVFIFSTSHISALAANSSNYSVSMFGTGMATANHASSNYNSIFLSEVKGTTRNMEGGNYIGNIGFFSDPAPFRAVSITSYSISPKSAVIGSTIGLSISALNYESLWVEIISPNAQEETLNLINGQTIIYLPSPLIIGRYNVTFYANSSLGAIASVVDYFELIEEVIVPEAPAPSQAGGEYCEYIWDCDSWSICLGEKQIRECKNIGTCTGTSGKPIEERDCSDALFDVTIKFEDLEITENDILKFNVSLTETKGIEKIDVQIKISIIDNQGNEIFSQIETRAIQGELTFEKEIDEIKGIIPDGEYILRIDILYGNLQRAFAEQKFIIFKEKIERPPKEKIFTEEFLIISGSLLFLIILIMLVSIFILIRLIRKREKEERKRRRGYKGRIKNNLKRIGSKPLLMIIFALITVGLLFIARKSMAGLVISDQFIGDSGANILGVILIIGILGLLVFLSRNKIKISIEKAKEKLKLGYSKNSIKGLIKKKVYTEEGEYVGKVSGVIIGDNKIDSLKIKLDKLDKRKKAKVSGIIVKYRNVINTGDIVIIDYRVLEYLNKFQ